MKQFLLCGLWCLLISPLFAQDSSRQKIPVSDDIREKLVTLALQGPTLEVADRQITIAKYQLKEAKGWWLNNISLAFNANDFTVKRLMGKTQESGELYPIYPIYNFGLNIPIGGIFSKPAATKAAREQVGIAQAQRGTVYRQIRASVLAAYDDYLTNKQLLTLQSQATESAYNDFLQSKQKFISGQISIDDYNSAAQQYHSQVVGKINAQHSFNLTKIQLESLIGVPIENVLNNQIPSAAPSDSTRSK